MLGLWPFIESKDSFRSNNYKKLKTNCESNSFIALISDNLKLTFFCVRSYVEKHLTSTYRELTLNLVIHTLISQFLIAYYTFSAFSSSTNQNDTSVHQHTIHRATCHRISRSTTNLPWATSNILHRAII